MMLTTWTWLHSCIVGGAILYAVCRYVARPIRRDGPGVPATPDEVPMRDSAALDFHLHKRRH